MVRIGIYFATIYVVIWLVIFFALMISYGERPLKQRDEDFVEYLWNDWQWLSIVFMALTILLIPVLLFAYREERAGLKVTQYMRRMPDGSFVIEERTPDQIHDIYMRNGQQQMAVDVVRDEPSSMVDQVQNYFYDDS